MGRARYGHGEVKGLERGHVGTPMSALAMEFRCGGCPGPTLATSCLGAETGPIAVPASAPSRVLLVQLMALGSAVQTATDHRRKRQDQPGSWKPCPELTLPKTQPDTGGQLVASTLQGPTGQEILPVLTQAPPCPAHPHLQVPFVTYSYCCLLATRSVSPGAYLGYKK